MVLIKLTGVTRTTYYDENSKLLMKYDFKVKKKDILNPLIPLNPLIEKQRVLIFHFLINKMVKNDQKIDFKTL